MCCFADDYKKVKEFIKENSAIKVAGKIMYDKCDGTKKISMWEAERLRPEDKVITVYGKLYLSEIDEKHGELWNLLKPYVSRHGYPMRLYDTLMDEFRDTNFLVTSAIQKDKRIRSSFQEF